MTDQVVEFLRKIGAEAAADAIEKTMTVGDVHQSTALGNEKPKKKTFADTLSTIDEKQPQGKVIDMDKGFTEWSLPVTITKVNEEKQQIFGWASVSTKGGNIVVDKQDSMIETDELEKGAYRYVLYARQQGDMHQEIGVGRMIESMMFTKAKQDALGIDLGQEGWWVGYQVDDKNVWKDIRGGKKPEFSIGGRGKRVEVV